MICLSEFFSYDYTYCLINLLFSRFILFKSEIPCEGRNNFFFKVFASSLKSVHLYLPFYVTP